MVDDICGLVAVILIFGFIPMLLFRLIRSRAGGSVDRAQPDPLFQTTLTQAEAHATRLEERIDQLERILDEDIPGWRARNAR